MGYKNNWSLENPQIWIQFFILTDLININDHKTITLIKNNAVIDCVINRSSRRILHFNATLYFDCSHQHKMIIIIVDFLYDSDIML